jgi:lauroyl/myristoyl acyltransferase
LTAVPLKPVRTAPADSTAPGPMRVEPRPRTGRGIRGRLKMAALRGASATVSRLPERPLNALADATGELWYRAAPARASQGRRNLARVCAWLAANDLATDRVRAAAEDPRALERLVRSAFRHAARYYLEVARVSTVTSELLTERLMFETPEVVDEALDGRASIIVGLHFGAIEMPAVFIARRTGVAVTIPMETIADPSLQAWFEQSRGATGVRLVGLREARRELQAALRRGEPVGIVADRDLTGGGIPVTFFGAPASLPVGPGLLAIEAGASVYVASVRRVARGRFRGRVEAVAVPSEGTRRERLTGFLEAEARAFERAIAAAPDQWWAIFFPIWPDLAAGEVAQ